jgi:glycosyltransferase involved in cell wall biosynthesis
MHDERYATTRRLTGKKPGCFDIAVDSAVTLLETPDSDKKIAQGGLRLQGFFKIHSQDKPLITVVTVVYNGAEYLEDTIKSVIDQTYDNVEYIIIDGASTDGTLDIIRKYEHAIDYWVSESDKGIYDAMNKGIDLAGGDWINFMNAGDYFFNSEVLSLVFTVSENYKDVAVIYGGHEVRYHNKKKAVKAGRVESLWKGSQFCHQSAFIRLKDHKLRGYNLNIILASDYDYFSEKKRTDSSFYRLKIFVSSVSSGGVSDSDRSLVYREWRNSALKNNLNRKHILNLNYFFSLANYRVKRLVKFLISKV